MKSYIEKKVLNLIRSKGNSILRKMGVAISIEGVCMLSINKYKLSNLSIIKANEKLVEIDSVVVKTNIWSFLFHHQLTGVLKIDKIHSTWNVISEQAFYLHNIETIFKIKGRRVITLYVELNGISISLYAENKNHSIEFRTKISGNWNSYLSLLRKNLFFNNLKHLKSSDNIIITALVRTVFSEKINTFFNAHIKSNAFSLAHCSESANTPPFTITKDFLVCRMKERLGNNDIGNQTYISFENIPMCFINAIICTEDPNFWQHKGIDPIAIGLAISTNIKEKKFVRGASTISMQLVRNLFLNHDKNIVRKIEESVITLLIENYYKIKKNDILEVYTNIIEFAPNVRGLYSASQFYFGKSHAELSLTECLVLTYAIPRPKHFYDALLSKSEQLIKNLSNHLSSYSNTMLFKWLITSNEYTSVTNTIEFAPQFGTLVLPDIENKLTAKKFDTLDKNDAKLKDTIVILDNGHGDNTSGKRSPIWDDGKQLFEFDFNRDVVNRIAFKLQMEGINHVKLVPELEDVEIEERCQRADRIAKDFNGNAILISIHANGGGATGWECFTSKEKPGADIYAKTLCEQFREDFPEWIMRFNPTLYLCHKGDFAILNNVNCPAILSENFFMDNEKDCRFIMSEAGRNRIASSHVEAIKKMIMNEQL